MRIKTTLPIYLINPEATDEMIALLIDRRVMQAIHAGERARREGSENYYVKWEKVRGG